MEADRVEVRVRCRDTSVFKKVKEQLEEIFVYVLDDGNKQEHDSDVFRQYFTCVKQR